MAFDLAKLLSGFNPEGKQGQLLLTLNAAGMLFAAISNTYATIADKNTKPEDKKFLVPAGAVTGAANIALYYTLTERIIAELKGRPAKFDKNGKVRSKAIVGYAEQILQRMKQENVFDKFADKFVLNKLKKAEKGILFGIGKKSPDYVASLKNTLLNYTQTGASEYGKKVFASDFKAGAGVLGAFIGAIVGSAILTPIIRDISSYIVQKRMERNQPDLTTKPYRQYIDPTHSGGLKQPLTMRTYMALTNRDLKI